MEENNPSIRLTFFKYIMKLTIQAKIKITFTILLDAEINSIGDNDIK